MKNLKVTEKYNNKKLVNFLLDNIDGLSTSTIYKTLRKKDIKINDKRTSENCLLRTGDDIKIYLPDNLLQKELNIPIVFEDDNVIILEENEEGGESRLKFKTKSSNTTPFLVMLKSYFQTILINL